MRVLKKLNTFYSYIIIFISLFLLINYLDVINRGYFGQKYILILSSFFSIYWIISIFIFLFKRSQYTSYTSVIQRFWKRSLYLFWILELFLFFIYLFLVLSCSSEVEWMYDQSQLFKSQYFVGFPFFKNLLILFCLIFITILSQNNIIYKNNNYVYIYIFLSIILLNQVVLNEFTQLYFFSVYYSGVKWNYDLDNKCWSIITDIEKMRTLTHYTFLLIVLKFWHTMFIVSFYLIFVMFLVQQKQIFQGGFSSNKQNFYFLYFFGFIMYYWIYKFYMNHIYNYTYSWFFVNKFYSNLFNLNIYFNIFKSFL